MSGSHHKLRRGTSTSKSRLLDRMFGKRGAELDEEAQPTFVGSPSSSAQHALGFIQIVNDGDLGTLKRLLTGKADQLKLINAQDSLGWSALHYAAWLDRPDIIRQLLLARANPNLVTNDGSSA